MNLTELIRLSPLKLAKLIRNRDVSSQELVSLYLERINDIDKHLNAFITVDPDLAIAQAKRIDKKIQLGEKLTALAGVPVAIKDSIVTKSYRTTCASKMLQNWKPP